MGAGGRFVRGFGGRRVVCKGWRGGGVEATSGQACLIWFCVWTGGYARCRVSTNRSSPWPLLARTGIGFGIGCMFLLTGSGEFGSLQPWFCGWTHRVVSFGRGWIRVGDEMHGWGGWRMVGD